MKLYCDIGFKETGVEDEDEVELSYEIVRTQLDHKRFG